MKLTIHAAIISVIMGISAILGVSKKASYTDITSKANYMDRFYVAEIPTSLAVDDCQILKERLPESPFIIKVTPKAQPENFFSGRRQKVTVEKVYSGNRLNVGDDIYITSYCSALYPPLISKKSSEIKEGIT